MLKKGVSNLTLNSVYLNYSRYQILACINSFDFFDKIFPKRIFPVESEKFAFVRASMVASYYIKLFHTRADRHNGILMSFLLLVAETNINKKKVYANFRIGKRNKLSFSNIIFILKMHLYKKNYHSDVIKSVIDFSKYNSSKTIA